MLRNYGVSVHFSSFHNDYPDAFQYVTKDDAHYITSQNHPPLLTPHKTRNASVATRKRGATSENAEGVQELKKKKEEKKSRRLSAGLLADYVRKQLRLIVILIFSLILICNG